MNDFYTAAVYTRISISESKTDEDSTSINNQKSIINDFCNKNKIKIYDYYTDDGYSGGSFDRPEFKRMLNDLNKGVINLVITKDISRLGRDFITTGNYIYKFFPENNIRYIAVLDNYDSLKPSLSDDIIPFKAVLNDMYLKDISIKIKSSRHELMKQGYYMGSTVPYGYKRSESDSRLFLVDSEKASVVKRIFLMKKSGLSSSYIAELLTEDGVCPPNKRMCESTYLNKKALWKSQTIDYILQNEVYIGNLIQRKYDRVSLKSKKKRLLDSSEWIIVENNHDAIVDRDLFYSVNENIKKETVRHKKYCYLLKGLVICHECKKKMIVRRTKSGVIYCCKSYAKSSGSECTMHYFRENVLNDIVIKKLCEMCRTFFKEEIKESFVKKIDAFKFLDEKIKKVDVELEKSNLVIYELYKDKTKCLISASDYNVLKNQVDKEIEQKNRYKQELLLRKSKLILNSNQLIDEILDFKRTEILARLINHITIDIFKNIRIYYNFSYSR